MPKNPKKTVWYLHPTFSIVVTTSANGRVTSPRAWLTSEWILHRVLCQWHGCCASWHTCHILALEEGQKHVWYWKSQWGFVWQNHSSANVMIRKFLERGNAEVKIHSQLSVLKYVEEYSQLGSLQNKAICFKFPWLEGWFKNWYYRNMKTKEISSSVGLLLLQAFWYATSGNSRR